ncbi:MAG TPA: histidinol-phosphate transaminase [Dermatophilaceae bacterium]|nr:histidinol-phosphate transaminase [Dermatophilaceae bacterium]
MTERPDTSPASADLHPRLRAALDRVPAYVPGKPARAPEGVTAYKLSSNENPFPPLDSVRVVLDKQLDTINRYPDMASVDLIAAIAAFVGCDPANIAVGTGSVGILGQIVQSTCDAGDEVVYAWRSFEAYPIVAALADAVGVPVAVDEGQRHRLDAMAAAVTDRTRVVIVCSPNNPTGTVVHRAELEAFLQAVPRHVLVVLDEAYTEFVTDPDAPDAIEVWRANPNVMVLRTFSKAYGLAGLRVGYAVAHEAVAAALRKTAVPFGVNSLAQAAAIASLEARDELMVRVRDIVAERERVAAGLAEQGWALAPSEANFVWFPIGTDGAAFAEACEAAGLMVRRYGDDGVRVTIGEPEANTRFLEVCRTFGPR